MNEGMNPVGGTLQDHFGGRVSPDSQSFANTNEFNNYTA